MGLVQVSEPPEMRPPGYDDPPPPPGYGDPPPGYGDLPHVGPTGQEPPPGYTWSGWPGGDTSPAHGSDRSRRWSFFRRASVAWAVAAALALSTGGLAFALATSGGSTPAASSDGHHGGFGGFGGNGSGFPGAGDLAVFGTVASVASGSFTVTSTGSGKTYTVDERSSTTYRNGDSTASASDVATGDRVAVAGSTSGTTVTATTVTILPAGGYGGGAPGGSS